MTHSSQRLANTQEDKEERKEEKEQSSFANLRAAPASKDNQTWKIELGAAAEAHMSDATRE